MDCGILNLNCCVFLLSLLLCKCDSPHQCDVFSIFGCGRGSGRTAAFSSAEPRILQQSVRVNDPLRFWSGSGLFRSRLHSARQMVVYRIYPVDCPYCDMAGHRRIMVESVRDMVEKKADAFSRSAFFLSRYCILAKNIKISE